MLAPRSMVILIVPCVACISPVLPVTSSLTRGCCTSLPQVAFLGFVAQHAATGKGPLAALGEHLANPWNANFATNGVSVPFF